MTPAAPAHLLIADRDERLRELLRQYLRKRGYLISLARDIDHARRLLTGLEFDLCLIDAALPEAEALAGAIAGPVLMLLPRDVAAGDRPAIAKPFEPKALLSEIEQMLDRTNLPVPVVPRILVMGALRFEIERGALTRGEAAICLTATELALLRLLAARLGEPIGRAELMALLGRSGFAAKARAVDVQITRLRRKLEENPKLPRYLQTVRGAGYMLVTG